MIEVIEIESKKHAQQLAKEAGFDSQAAWDRLAKYLGDEEETKTLDGAE